MKKSKKTCGILAGIMVLSMMTTPMAGMNFFASAEDADAAEISETETPENTDTSGVLEVFWTGMKAQAKYQVSDDGCIDVDIIPEHNASITSRTPSYLSANSYEDKYSGDIDIAFNKNSFNMQVSVPTSVRDTYFETYADASAIPSYRYMRDDGLSVYDLILTAKYYRNDLPIAHIRLTPKVNSNSEKVILFDNELTTATSRMTEEQSFDFGEVISEDTHSVALSDGTSAKKGIETITAYENGTYVYKLKAENLGNAASHPYMPSTTLSIPFKLFRTQVIANDYGCEISSGEELAEVTGSSVREDDFNNQFLPCFYRDGEITLIITPFDDALLDKNAVLSFLSGDVQSVNNGSYPVFKDFSKWGIQVINTETEEEVSLPFQIDYSVRNNGIVRILFYNMNTIQEGFNITKGFPEDVTYKVHSDTQEVQDGYDYYNTADEFVYWSADKDDWRFEFGEELRYESHYEVKKVYPDTLTIPDCYKIRTVTYSDNAAMILDEQEDSPNEYGISMSFKAGTVLQPGLFAYIELKPTSGTIVKYPVAEEEIDTEGNSASERLFPETVKILADDVSIYTNNVTLDDGDINGDGQRTLVDLIALRNYLHNQYVFSEAQFYAADMNDDGKVNIYDFNLLKRLLISER